MGLKGLIRRSVCAALAVGAVTAGLIISAPSTVAGAATPTSATFAEQANQTPNFILPFYPGSDCSVANIAQLQYLMYRPLYSYGNGTTPAVNPNLSLANKPVFSNGDKTVTVTLKSNYKWSDGESVTGEDVVFFMNWYHAEKANFCGYVSGEMPDNVYNVSASGQKVTFLLSGSVNPNWFLDNELSQITPMPLAWDITSAGAAPGSGGCAASVYGHNDTGCSAVYTYMADQAGYNPNNPSAANNSLATYATNSLWQVVDGPWKLKAFNADGNVTFVPNPKYQGPVKPTLKSFSEVPYTSDSSEYSALLAGDLSYGYVPTSDLTSPAKSPSQPGANVSRLASDYNLDPLYAWDIGYFPINFNSTADNGMAGKIFSQLYFRQAVMYLIDQPLYDQKIWKGYAVSTYGPVPVYPNSTELSATEKNNPYPYNPAKGKALLADHGWSIKPGGIDTCLKPGTASNECGAGIVAGAQLNFQMPLATGVAAETQMMEAEVSSWAKVGLKWTIQPQTFDNVISNAVACTASSSCTWQAQNWGGVWIYDPDTYPTGDELFGTGSVANYGSYSNAQNDALIKKTAFGTTPLSTWENFMAKQVPVIWEPSAAVDVFEINKNLKGTTPLNTFDFLLPEEWRWK
jgi:peptide/nickel transport system substrate-binding protein